MAETMLDAWRVTAGCGWRGGPELPPGFGASSPFPLRPKNAAAAGSVRCVGNCPRETEPGWVSDDVGGLGARRRRHDGRARFRPRARCAHGKGLQSTRRPA